MTYSIRGLKVKLICSSYTCHITKFSHTVEDQVEIARRVAWYVSLIPSLADMTLFPGVCDMWANSEVCISCAFSLWIILIFILIYSKLVMCIVIYSSLCLFPAWSTVILISLFLLSGSRLISLCHGKVIERSPHWQDLEWKRAKETEKKGTIVWLFKGVMKDISFLIWNLQDYVFDVFSSWKMSLKIVISRSNYILLD